MFCLTPALPWSRCQMPWQTQLPMIPLTQRWQVKANKLVPKSRRQPTHCQQWVTNFWLLANLVCLQFLIAMHSFFIHTQADIHGEQDRNTCQQRYCWRGPSTNSGNDIHTTTKTFRCNQKHSILEHTVCQQLHSIQALCRRLYVWWSCTRHSSN